MVPVLLALAGCAAPVCKPRPIALVPLRFNRNQPIFDGVLNGVPVPMLFDTGAEYSVITPETGAMIKVRAPINSLEIMLGAGGVVFAPAVTIKRFQMGIATGSAFSFKVLRLATLGARPTQRIGGLIGNDVFHNYDLDLDFPHDHALLIDTTSCAGVVPWDGVLRPVRFQRGLNGGVLVHAQVDGRPALATIDTGATNTVMSSWLFNRLRLAAGHPVVLGKSHGVGAGAQQFRVTIYRLRTLSVGGVVMSDPVIAVGGNSGVLRSLLILGEDFIHRHQIYISYPRRILYVRAAR